MSDRHCNNPLLGTPPQTFQVQKVPRHVVSKHATSEHKHRQGKSTYQNALQPCTNAATSAGKDTAAAHLSDGALCAQVIDKYCPLNLDDEFNAPEEGHLLAPQAHAQGIVQVKLVTRHAAACSYSRNRLSTVCRK